jgi:hypothetical protein
MQTSNQRGRGNDPVVVLGKIRFAVAVNMRRSVVATGENRKRERGGNGGG